MDARADVSFREYLKRFMYSQVQAISVDLDQIAPGSTLFSLPLCLASFGHNYFKYLKPHCSNLA